MLSYIIQLLFPLIPESRLFKLKAFLLRLRGYKIGKDVRVWSSAVFRLKHLSIGDGSRIGSETLIHGGDAWVIIGKNVGIAPRCLIISGSHEIGYESQRSGRGYSTTITIGDGSTIFAHSTVLDGVSIGRGCVIAAGSLVRDNVDDNHMVAGVPASIIRKLP